MSATPRRSWRGISCRGASQGARVVPGVHEDSRWDAAAAGGVQRDSGVVVHSPTDLGAAWQANIQGDAVDAVCRKIRPDRPWDIAANVFLCDGWNDAVEVCRARRWRGDGAAAGADDWGGAAGIQKGVGPGAGGIRAAEPALRITGGIRTCSSRRWMSTTLGSFRSVSFRIGQTGHGGGSTVEAAGLSEQRGSLIADAMTRRRSSVAGLQDVVKEMFPDDKWAVLDDRSFLFGSGLPDMAAIR